mmetsp:Transcript_10601/g.24210  ORF Transcript_10601/g.24210 Transcript_10601/m.24210 type:complete len:434 (+) Transcript_10601:116-1417(+)
MHAWRNEPPSVRNHKCTLPRASKISKNESMCQSKKMKEGVRRAPAEEGREQAGGLVPGGAVTLLFLCAFLFSLMGMFLQYTGRFGIPSNEMVFLRAVFQGVLVVGCMVHCRIDCHVDTTSTNLDEEALALDDAREEKKLDECDHLLQKGYQATYGLADVETAADKRARTTRIIFRPFGSNMTQAKIVMLRGFIGGLGFCNYYYTLSTLPLGDATTLLSLYPIVTIFLAYYVLNEAIKPAQLVAAVLSVLGGVLISRPSFLFGSDDASARPPLLGYFTAIIGSCCAAGVIVLIRKAGRSGANTLQLLFSWVVFGISWSLLLAFLTGSKPGQQWRVPSAREFPYVLGACLSGTLAHFILNYAAKLIPAGVSGLVRSSDIFWAYILEIAVLNEHPVAATWWGVALVSVALTILIHSTNREKEIHKDASQGNLTAAK